MGGYPATRYHADDVVAFRFVAKQIMDNKQTDFKNSSFHEEEKVLSTAGKTILNTDNSNSKLIGFAVKPSELIALLRLRYGSMKDVASKIGVSESRLRQIFIGQYVPVKVLTIRRYALAWDIDAIILSQVFDQLREAKK